MFPQSFEEAIAASHEALRAMALGDPEPSQRQYSRRGDEALSDPVVAPIVGYDRIAAETARVAAGFTGGAQSFAFDEVVRVVTPDLGYVLGFERMRVRRVGQDEPAVVALRVTTVFRREDDGWKLVLRFADRNGTDGRGPDRSGVTGMPSLEPEPGDVPVLTPDFDTAAVKVYREMQATIARPTAQSPAEFRSRGSIWSRRDDVALANPLGPPIVGWANVMREAWAIGAGRVGDGATQFEELTRVVTPDLGFTLGYEHYRLRRPGREEIETLNIRLVTIYRRETDGWKRVLRHADRITVA